ncbi:MAG: anthranilate phosphoribosyltransferase [Enterobacterales bacterium]
MYITNIIEKIMLGNAINYNQSYDLFTSIINGLVSKKEIKNILIKMKFRNTLYSTQELCGAVHAFLTCSLKFPSPKNYLFADIVGTGGDKSNSINISTISAIVATGCGAKIVKHGNYNTLSKVGSFNLLNQFGIKIDISSQNSRKILDELGICFLLAPQYHKSFKNIMPIRKKLNTTTFINVFSPLINPSKPPLTLIGVYKPKLIKLVANSLLNLGYLRAAVVHSGGMDEVSLHAPTIVAEIKNNKINTYTLYAKDFGLPKQRKSSLEIKSKEDNINITTKLLQGCGKYEHECVVAANVALLLKLFGHENLCKNAYKALNEIRSGKSYIRLINLIKKTQEYN